MMLFDHTKNFRKVGRPVEWDVIGTEVYDQIRHISWCECALISSRSVAFSNSNNNNECALSSS